MAPHELHRQLCWNEHVNVTKSRETEVTRSNIVTSLDSPSLYGEFCRLHRGLRSPSDSILITELRYVQARSLPSAAVRPSICHVRLFYPDGYYIYVKLLGLVASPIILVFGSKRPYPITMETPSAGH